MKRWLVALALVAAACGGGSEGESARRAQVGEVRAAAEAGDVERARTELEELRGLIDGQLADGEVDDAEAMRVLAAADDVEAALGPPPTSSTTTTSTTTTAPPPPPDDDKDDDDEDDDDDGRGGRGKGKEKDDD